MFLNCALFWLATGFSEVEPGAAASPLLGDSVALFPIRNTLSASSFPKPELVIRVSFSHSVGMLRCSNNSSHTQLRCNLPRLSTRRAYTSARLTWLDTLCEERVVYIWLWNVKVIAPTRVWAETRALTYCVPRCKFSVFWEVPELVKGAKKACLPVWSRRGCKCSKAACVRLIRDGTAICGFCSTSTWTTWPNCSHMLRYSLAFGSKQARLEMSRILSTPSSSTYAAHMA